MADTTDPAPTPRQTQRYLRDLLRANGLEPKAKLGQNFLIDLNLIDLIVREAELGRADVVLEVGTGTGGLTAELADRAGHVVSVEIDRDFHRLASRHLAGRPNVDLVQADALARKNLMNPDVLERLKELLKRDDLQNLKLIANLPYAVATPVITNLLIQDAEVSRMVVMAQWEIGEKLVARPGTKEFGALAVLVQSLAETELVRRLAPSVFWPRPAVDSAIVKVCPSRAKRDEVGPPQLFRDFLRDLYVHKRKNLRQALAGAPQGRRDKAEVDVKLAEMGLDGAARAETLSVADHLRLRAAFPPLKEGS